MASDLRDLKTIHAFAMIVDINGFEKMVDRVARLEQAFGIHDLAQFTPA